MEPPPNVLKAGQLPARIRTGAKTATKDQERDYLDRFRAVARDPTPLVPRWLGSGTDPFGRTRRKLAAIQKRRDSTGWLKWYARGRKFHNAYAATLLVLLGGKIPSFASIKFRGRDVKFVLRGRGLRNHLAAIQNYEQPDVRLLGYLEAVRKHKVVVASTDDAFVASPSGDPLPVEILQAPLADADVAVTAKEGRVECAHAGADTACIDFALAEVGRSVALCRDCLDDLGGDLSARLESALLAPRGRLTIHRTLFGSALRVHPASARPELDDLVAKAGRQAITKSKGYEGVTDVKILDWAKEAFDEALEARPGGFLLIDKDLWLSDFHTAIDEHLQDDLERRLVKAAWQKEPPRVRTGDAGVNRFLEPVWGRLGVDLLRGVAGEAADQLDLAELAKLRPTEALQAVARGLRSEERFSAFPRFSDLAPPLRFAQDLFRSHKANDASAFQQRLSNAVRDPQLKPLALALARAFNQSRGIEWQYSPHEKDQALFIEPYARALALAEPDQYENLLGELAEALNVPRPTRPMTT